MIRFVPLAIMPTVSRLRQLLARSSQHFFALDDKVGKGFAHNQRGLDHFTS